jgi:hypothetical protein
MNKHSQQIKDIIEYLVKVYNKEDVGGISQNFFRTLPKLDELIDSYFRDFENSDEQNKAIAHKLEALNKLSFNENKEGYTIYKEDIDPSEDSPVKLSNEQKFRLNLSKEEHLRYASSIHKHIVKSFKDKLGIKPTNKAKEIKVITVRDKKVSTLLKQLNLKIDFLNENCSHDDFLNVITGKSKKNIYLNIPNGTFRYILQKLKRYFFNYSITAVANTEKIHSSKGTILTPKNILNSPIDYPKHKDIIDIVFFENN